MATLTFNQVGDKYVAEFEATTDFNLHIDYTESGEEFGTLENPIAYNGNMALEQGKYYEQEGVVYLCTRDTGIAVYQPLSALVGLYVEKV